MLQAGRRSKALNFALRAAAGVTSAYEDLNQVTRNFQDAAVAAIGGMGGTIATIAGFIERAIDYLRKAGQRSIERSANAEAIGHLTRALKLLQSRPDNPQRKRAAFALEVMLSQAMIASYGYAAPSTRQALLRARALIDESTDSLQKFAMLYGLWASHYTAGEPAKLWDTAVEFLAKANVPIAPLRCVLRID